MSTPRATIPTRGLLRYTSLSVCTSLSVYTPRAGMAFRKGRQMPGVVIRHRDGLLDQFLDIAQEFAFFRRAE